MARIPTIVPMSDLRQDAGGVLKKLRGSRKPMFITQRGRPAAVLMSIHAYQDLEAQRDVLLLLVRGEQEIAAGNGHTLESIVTEADDLLSRKPFLAR